MPKDLYTSQIFIRNIIILLPDVKMDLDFFFSLEDLKIFSPLTSVRAQNEMKKKREKQLTSLSIGTKLCL